MPPVGFEPTISAGERPRTYALDRAATGTGGFMLQNRKWLNKPAKQIMFKSNLKYWEQYRQAEGKKEM